MATRLGRVFLFNMAALWFYIAGGRLSNTVLLLAGLVSLAYVPAGFKHEMFTKNILALVASIVLLFLGALNMHSTASLPLFSISIQLVFSAWCASLVVYGEKRLPNHGLMVKAVWMFFVALSCWAVFYSFKIMPQHQLVGEIQSGGEDALQSIGGIFFVGNNYYTLTYYILAPMAAAVACIFSPIERKSVVLLCCGLICFGLSMIFGRRAPIVCCGTTLLVFMVVMVKQSQHRIRVVLRMIWRSVLLGFLVLLFMRWESTMGVSERFSDRISSMSQDVRFDLWNGALHAIYHNPWGGVDYSFGISRYAHNAILDVALGVGILGAFLFASMIVNLTWRVGMGWMKKNKKNDLFENVLVALVLTHVIAMMSEPFLPIRFVIFMWAGVTWTCLYEKFRFLPTGRVS